MPCRSLAERARKHDRESPYLLLGKWAHMLGFRGHFSTESRRYSVTLGRLRRARHRYQRLAAEAHKHGEPLDVRDLEERLLAEEEETTLVIGTGPTKAPAGPATATKRSPSPQQHAHASTPSGEPTSTRPSDELGRRDKVMDEQVVFPRLLTVRDVAEILCVPVSTVHHWAVRGEGPPSFKIGKHRRFDAATVRQWIDDAKRAAA